MSFLTNSINMVEAQGFLEKKFQQVHLHDVEENNLPRRSFLSGFLLHSRKCNQATKITRHVNKGLPNKRSQSELIAAHGFFLIGFPETPFCVCIYTKSAAETNKLLQFDQQLFPCCNVAAVQPKIQGKQSGTDNLIIATNEPLVPLPTRNPLVKQHLPPVITDTPDYRFLHFETSTLQIEEAFAVTKRCNGRLCDGASSIASSCLCTNDRGRSTWAIHLKIKSTELSVERLENCKAEMTSIRMQNWFVNQPNDLEPGEHSWDTFDFADKIIEYMEAVNEQTGQKIEVMGWYKPSSLDNEGVIRDPRSIHLINFVPKLEVETSIYNLRFNMATSTGETQDSFGSMTTAEFEVENANDPSRLSNEDNGRPTDNDDNEEYHQVFQ